MMTEIIEGAVLLGKWKTKKAKNKSSEKWGPIAQVKGVMEIYRGGAT